jgi:hypothetical protein
MKSLVIAAALLSGAQALAAEGGECPATDASAITEMAGIVGVAASLPAATIASMPIAQSSPEADLVAAFYQAFVTGDFAGMESRYAEDVSFKDPIFEYENRAGTMGMWRNLLGAQTGGRFTYKVTGVKGDTVTVHWIADYEVFGPRCTTRSTPR